LNKFSWLDGVEGDELEARRKVPVPEGFSQKSEPTKSVKKV
jgi:hypothetical protein